MALAITWTDAEDGTGGTLAVTGADSATTVTAYAQAVDATGLRTPTWTSKGTRSGDGSMTVSLDPGYYWLHVAGTVSGSPAISNLAYAYATEATDALASRCMDALAARISGLTMAGASDTAGTASYPNARVYKQVLPQEGLVQYPCVLLTLEGESESQEGTTTNKDDIGYPIQVAVVDRADSLQPTRRKLWLKWRQQVFRAIRNQRLAGVTESLIVKVTPRLVFDPRLPSYQVVILGFLARCLCRETRGT